MRINGTTKLLVVNHLAESAAGVITIRAFKKEDQFFTKNLDLIDTNASPFFHSFSANEWLIQWIELVSSTIFTSAALCMVLLPPRTFSSGQYTLYFLEVWPLQLYGYFYKWPYEFSTTGFIGMALSYGLSLNMIFVRTAQKQCTLDNNMICVERLNQCIFPMKQLKK